MRPTENAINLETVSEEGFGSWDKLKKTVFRSSDKEKDQEVKITPLTFKKLSETTDHDSLSHSVSSENSVNFRTEILSGLTNDAFVQDDSNDHDHNADYPPILQSGPKNDIGTEPRVYSSILLNQPRDEEKKP